MTYILTIASPSPYQNIFLMLSDNLYFTKIPELTTAFTLIEDDFGLVQNTTSTSFSSYKIKKIQLNGKYITVSMKYNTFEFSDNNYLPFFPKNIIFNLTDVFYFNASTDFSKTVFSNCYASLFLDQNNNLCMFCFNNSVSQFKFTTIEGANEGFFANTDFCDNTCTNFVFNPILISHPSLSKPLQNNLTFLSIVSPVFFQNCFLILGEGDSIKTTDDKSLATNITVVSDDFGNVLNVSSFPVQKIMVNDKYVTISARFSDVSNQNDNMITLTDTFYFQDSVAFQTPFASLFLDQNNAVCAYFSSSKQFVVQNYLQFAAPFNDVMHVSLTQ